MKATVVHCLFYKQSEFDKHNIIWRNFIMVSEQGSNPSALQPYRLSWFQWQMTDKKGNNNYMFKAHNDIKKLIVSLLFRSVILNVYQVDHCWST